MSTSLNSLTVGPGPHWRHPNSLTRVHYAFVLALAPTALAGAIGHAFGDKAADLNSAFGPMNQLIKILTVEMGLDSGILWLFGILGTVALGMGVGVFVEYASQVAMRQPYRATDGHGLLMGMLVALLMPPTVPWWVLVIGVAVAVFLGKQIFGGIGAYPMHPAVVGWLVLLLSWPNYLYPVGAASIAAPNETAIGATLIGGVILWLAGVIRPQVTLGAVVGVVLFSLLFAERLTGGVLHQLLTGHVILGAFFLATDATCSPANQRAMWLYGFGIGFLIMLIRAYGIWPDAVPFAVLLMNVVNPLLDRFRPRARAVGTLA